MIALEAGRGGPLTSLAFAGVVSCNRPVEACPDPCPVAVISWGKSLGLCLSLLIPTVGGALLPPHW